MKAFARLFAALDETNRTNEKVAAMVEYFESVPAADAAWTVYFLSGGRPKRLIPVRRLSAWAMEEADVPGLAVRRVLRRGRRPGGDDRAPAAGDRCDVDRCRCIAGSTERLLPLATQREEEQREAVLAAWRELHGTARFVWNKLITGASASACRSSSWCARWRSSAAWTRRRSRTG